MYNISVLCKITKLAVFNITVADYGKNESLMDTGDGVQHNSIYILTDSLLLESKNSVCYKKFHIISQILLNTLLKADDFYYSGNEDNLQRTIYTLVKLASEFSIKPMSWILSIKPNITIKIQQLIQRPTSSIRDMISVTATAMI